MDGCCLFGLDCRIFRFQLAMGKVPGKDLGGLSMEIWYWIGGIVALGLLGYLVVALVKPEIFS